MEMANRAAASSGFHSEGRRQICRGGEMKQVFLYGIVCLFCILFGCSRPAQVAQNDASNRTDQTQASPVPTLSPSLAPKPRGERGTPDEAKAMMLKAIDHYNEVGRKQALEDFNSKKPPFFDRDLYVACVDSNHKMVANGGYPQLVGTSTDAWKDADGNSLGKATADAVSASPAGEATIRYRWYNPISHAIEPKVGFFRKAGDDICGVGAYNPQ
jgi:cytochrome c